MVARGKKTARRVCYRSVAVGKLLEDSDCKVSLGCMERLDLELLLLYQEVAPTQAEINSREYIFNRIKISIQNEFPGARVSPFGSHSTGLIIPSSDIDIEVLFPGEQRKKEYANKYLGKIRKMLARTNLVMPESLFHIRKSKTPILKFKDRIFGFRIDISVNKENGTSAARFVNRVLEERPYMKVFAILLKYFLNIRNQSDAAIGGLNSYSQFLLLLSFFQLHPLVQTNMISPLKNIGVLFLDFFQLYGCGFPYKTARISVNEVGYVRNDKNVLSIVDPTDPTLDVASVCRNFAEVFEIFQHAFKIMTAAIREGVPPQKSLISLWFRRRPEEAEWRKRVEKNYSKVFNTNVR